MSKECLLLSGLQPNTRYAFDGSKLISVVLKAFFNSETVILRVRLVMTSTIQYTVSTVKTQ